MTEEKSKTEKGNNSEKSWPSPFDGIGRGGFSDFHEKGDYGKKEIRVVDTIHPPPPKGSKHGGS